MNSKISIVNCKNCQLQITSGKDFCCDQCQRHPKTHSSCCDVLKRSNILGRQNKIFINKNFILDTLLVKRMQPLLINSRLIPEELILSDHPLIMGNIILPDQMQIGIISWNVLNERIYTITNPRYNLKTILKETSDFPMVKNILTIEYLKNVISMCQYSHNIILLQECSEDLIGLLSTDQSIRQNYNFTSSAKILESGNESIGPYSIDDIQRAVYITNKMVTLIPKKLGKIVASGANIVYMGTIYNTNKPEYKVILHCKSHRTIVSIGDNINLLIDNVHMDKRWADEDRKELLENRDIIRMLPRRTIHFSADQLNAKIDGVIPGIVDHASKKVIRIIGGDFNLSEESNIKFKNWTKINIHDINSLDKIYSDGITFVSPNGDCLFNAILGQTDSNHQTSVFREQIVAAIRTRLTNEAAFRENLIASIINWLNDDVRLSDENVFNELSTGIMSKDTDTQNSVIDVYLGFMTRSAHGSHNPQFHWGGNIEIEIAANLLNINIHIVNTGTEPNTVRTVSPTNPNQRTTNIYLQFKNNSHYNIISNPALINISNPPGSGSSEFSRSPKKIIDNYNIEQLQDHYKNKYIRIKQKYLKLKQQIESHTN